MSKTVINVSFHFMEGDTGIMFALVPDFSTGIRSTKKGVHTTGFCSQQDGLAEARKGVISKVVCNGSPSVLSLLHLIAVVKEALSLFGIISTCLKW